MKADGSADCAGRWGGRLPTGLCFYLVTFGNFWFTIQNTGNWHVSNAFDLLSVFISFPLARAAGRSHPTPPPLFGEGKVPKKTKKKKIVGVGEVAVKCKHDTSEV